MNIADAVRLVDLVSVPPEPMAGSTFNLVVQINQAQSVDVTILLEKQRILQDLGGQSILMSTGENYFSLKPQPILIPAGSTKSRSEPIAVRITPTAPPGDPAVSFPEHLFFSAHCRDQPFNKWRFLVVPIQAVEL